MNLFSDKVNYGEMLRRLESRRDPDGIEDPTRPLTDLSDGVYEGLRYGYTLELRNGDRYRTPTGVRHHRSTASWQQYSIKDGRFSGLAEVGGAMQGASYGPKDPDTSTKIKIDTDGFGIPKDVMKEFKISNNKQSRQFSSDGLFRGGIKTPTISITKDNTIMRTNGNKSIKTAANQPNTMTNSVLDWDNKAFHLAIEPWITSPLQNDICDGIYIGSIKANKIDTGKQIINLTVSIAIDYPESVLVLVKNKKAYVFKQSQLVATTGSRIFSTILFSEITSDEQFRDYAHNLMKGAHKDNYDEAKTDKVVNDLLENAGDKRDYGELIGRLRSGLGNKSYSEADGTVDYKFSYALVEPKLEMQALIGTLAMAPSFAKLFHWCTTDYGVHKAMDDFAKDLIDKVDLLAENYLATTKAVNFQICIIPDTMCPVRYLERLNEYIVKYQTAKLANESAFQSLVDDISNLIGSTLYKLKRLKIGKRLFSFVESDGTRLFTRDRAMGMIKASAYAAIITTIGTLVTIYIKKYRRSPIKEIQTKDGKRVKEYVRSHVKDPNILCEIVQSLTDGINDAATNISIYNKSSEKR